MDRRKWIGILGGVLFFVVFIFFLMFQSWDFDQQLIQSKNNGENKDNIIKKIEAESVEMKLKAKKHLMSHVMDEKFWSAPNISSESPLLFEERTYEAQMKTIEEYEDLRKQFIKDLISEEQFLNLAQDKKAVLENL